MTYRAIGFKYFRGGLMLGCLISALPLSAATITVNTTADPGVAGNCSLRAAIAAANANAPVNACTAGSGTDTINFAITPLDGTVKTITLAAASPLPDITAPVIINGYTQNGATANTLASGSNAVPKIVLNGINAGGSGLVLQTGASGSTVRGLVVQNFSTGGIQINASSNHTIAGNFVGTNAAATAAAGNGSDSFQGGIRVQAFGVGESVSNNVIGGSAPADRNVISGNSGAAISIFGGATSTGNAVLGNLIGSSKNGLVGIANNGRGITIGGAIQTVIGSTVGAVPAGPCSGGCNLVAGNFGQIELGSSATADGTVIQSNFVGTNISGTAALTSSLSNRLSGIIMGQANGSAANLGVTVGGTTVAARNLISGNSAEGIDIQLAGAVPALNVRILGNYIGTNAAGTGAVPNGRSGINVANTPGVVVGGTVAGSGNLISGNTDFGILLDGGSLSTIQSNLIGTQIDGVSPLGNGRNGLRITSGGFDLPSGNVVGATTGGTLGGNTIAFNAANQPGGGGVVIVAGIDNRISRNSIFSNKNFADDSGLGIDHFGDGPTPNDDCDLDGGADNLQNAPAFTARTNASVTTVSGVLNSTPATTFLLEFYASPPEVAPTLAPEGKLFLGATSVTTGMAPACSVSFNVVTATPAPAGHNVTAIAIAPNGDTSEFAQPDSLFANGFE